MLVMPKLLARAKEKQAPPTTRFTVMATRRKNTLPVPTHVQALIDALEALRPAYWTACHGTGSTSSTWMIYNEVFSARIDDLKLTDLNGDSSTGLIFSAGLVSIGSVTLGSNQVGYAIKDGAASPIQFSFSGQLASSSSPGAGWSAIAAAATSTGYEIFWKNAVTGQDARWVLDARGNYSSGALLSTPELLLAENRLNTDLNKDSITGVGILNTFTSTINGLSLGNTSFGYALQSGTNSAIPISLFGQLVSASNPGSGWSTIAATSSSTGYDLYWKNAVSGQFARWNLNSNGAYTSGGLLSNLELINAESSIGFDLTGNGIGVI
jgi:hypothetical protein